jgi:cystathionine beta-lyase/cystathionine gamma-synthase
MVPPADVDAVQAAMQPNTGIIFTEAPSNPHLYLPDLPALAEVAHAGNALLVIDATLASPCVLRPLTLGADLVIHSATKYLGGHNDVVGGVVCGSVALVEQIRALHMTLGGVLDPHGCFLLLRGLKTLSLRMERHNTTAMQVAQFLEAHPKVTSVYYPGLPSHPNHELAKRTMNGYGGMVSFEIAGDWDAAARFISRLELCLLASSLGGVETLVYHPATLLHYSMSLQEREKFGLVDSLIRLAVGIEHPDDIIADLERGLAAV